MESALSCNGTDGYAAYFFEFKNLFENFLTQNLMSMHSMHIFLYMPKKPVTILYDSYILLFSYLLQLLP